MDLYTWSLLAGAAGLGAMALGGLDRHGDSSAALGHAHHPPTHAHGHSHHTIPTSIPKGATGSLVKHAGWLLSAPRIVFSFLLGLGGAGELLKLFLDGIPLLAGSVVLGVLFERLFVTRIWNFALRFASNPARTLESSITDEATAVTAFNSSGEGIVSIEVDGQIVQCLATLQRNDRSLGIVVRAGQRLRIEEVNSQNNRCTVSVL